MIEFALVVPIVLLVLLAVVEVAVVARAQLEVVQASREGAREAATSPDPGRAVTAAKATLGPKLAAEATVRVKRPQVVGRRAEVVVSVPYRVAAPILGGFVVTLEAKASMRVER